MITTEQEREKFEKWANAKKTMGKSWNGEYYENVLHETAWQSWQACLRETGWVSVSDYKPKAYTAVLLYVPEWHRPDRNAIVMGVYIESLNEWRPHGSSGWSSSVTHWMPLPKPPD